MNLTRQRWVRKEPGAEKQLTQLPVRVRRWWWKDDTGKTYLSLKSGSRLLEIAPGRKAIEIGDLAELPKKLEILCEAVMAGELDACATDVLRRVPDAKKEKPTASLKPAGLAKETAKAH